MHGPVGTHHHLTLRRLGIDTSQETVIFMRRDCHVCRSEGFAVHARLKVTLNARTIIATLHHVSSDLLATEEASLSDSAWDLLGARDGDRIQVAHMEPIGSMSAVRAKMFGKRLGDNQIDGIVGDVAAGRYSDVELAAFLTACTAIPLDKGEVVALAKAMVNAGDRLDWGMRPIMDKHCIGGLPGNRTTPIVVAIVAACGLVIPKTSSRAITSPSGTADAMETLAPVALSVSDMRRVIEQEGGCVAWGGAVHLSPVDDLFIRIERALDLDSEGQLVASVLSKKIAAGSSHVVLDLPVGPSAKLRDDAAFDRLATLMAAVGDASGLVIRVMRTDGRFPVGTGIGPALEAHDVLAVLQNETSQSPDLRRRAVGLAGVLLEMGGVAAQGQGASLAETVLQDGRAWRKFQAICESQGGQRIPPRARHQHTVESVQDGIVDAVDNRVLAKIAKLAGAPDAKAAGLFLHFREGSIVRRGDPLITLHAESSGELSYALDYAHSRPDVIQFGPLQ